LLDAFIYLNPSVSCKKNENVSMLVLTKETFDAISINLSTISWNPKALVFSVDKSVCKRKREKGMRERTHVERGSQE
jgi:hypothetical protein